MLVKTNEEIVYLIADSITSATNALSWHVPADLPIDTSYKISIASLTHTSVSDSSDNAFSVDGPTGVSGSVNLITAYGLSQNYPNPFNPTTNFEFRVAEYGFVSIKVYDVLGREVKILVNEERPAGSYKVIFDAGDLSSGVYFYKMQAGSFTDTKKFILLR
jgi:hypothetical protein